MGGKGPTCQVCASPQRHLVELGLLHRMSLSVLAKRFSLHRDAIQRHKRKHMSAQLVAALLAAQHPSEIDLEALERSEFGRPARQPDRTARSPSDAKRDGVRGWRAARSDAR